jgi:hypothetical protein
MVLISLLALSLGNADPAPLPAACSAAGVDTLALEALADYGIAPLCASETPPKAGDYVLRLTDALSAEVNRQDKISAKHQVLRVAVKDSFGYPSSTEFNSGIAPSGFRHLLTDAGLDNAWGADDSYCPKDVLFTGENGLIWEFYDSSGYHARFGPKIQMCTTKYANINKELCELVKDLVDKGATRFP